MDRIIEYWDEYNKKTERWEIDGKLHREDGPAIEIYDEETGKICSESWYLNCEQFN